MPRYFSYIYFLFLICILCFAEQGYTQTLEVPKAEQGRMDLRAWDFENQGYVTLDGDWSFYYGDFLDAKGMDSLQAPLYLKVPGTWNGVLINGEKKNGTGVATYRLKIVMPPQKKDIGLKIDEISSAFDLFINGKKQASLGTPGTNPESHDPALRPMIIHLGELSDTLDIIFHVSNFSHINGGLWDTLRMGKTSDLYEFKLARLVKDTFLIGALLLMAFAHLGTYLLKRNEYSSVFFALICICTLLRTSVMGESLVFYIFPQVYHYFELIKKVEYVTFYSIVTFFFYFIYLLYPADFSKYVIWIAWVIWASFISFTLVTPVLLNSNLIFFYQIFILFSLTYLIYVTVMIVVRKRTDSGIFVFCFLFIVFAGINDVLYFNRILTQVELLPIGTFIFLYFQSFIISRRSVKSYQASERLGAELKELNSSLESQVEARTSELNENLRLVKAQKEEIETQYNFINSAKDTIEEKNRKLAEWQDNLQASIQYAQRIQAAILPAEKEIKPYFKDFFVLLKPRDIVSGDYYYVTKVENKTLVAAIDCTGHGVPGAFMSLIGHEILSNIIEKQKITKVDLILNELHRNIRKVLKQDQSDNRDGMDVALICIDTQNHLIEYAGAKNPLVYIQHGELKEIKADRMPIGGEQKETQRIFNRHVIPFNFQAQESMRLYMFSDGYKDQFGGKENKKFMLNQLKSLLLDIHQNPMDAQKKILENKLKDWMLEAKEKQIDDVLVLGIEL